MDWTWYNLITYSVDNHGINLINCNPIKCAHTRRSRIDGSMSMPTVVDTTQDAKRAKTAKRNAKVGAVESYSRVSAQAGPGCQEGQVAKDLVDLPRSGRRAWTKTPGQKESLPSHGWAGWAGKQGKGESVGSRYLRCCEALGKFGCHTQCHWHHP